MGTKPTSSVAWATDATFTSGDETGQTTRADPSALRGQGIYANRRIAARWFNFLMGAVGDWIQYLDASVGWLRNAKETDDAKGDNSTDDYAALQAGITALASAGGGVLVLNAGIYLLSAALVVPIGVSLKGVGNVVLSANSAHSDILQYSAGTHDSSPSDFVEGIAFAGKISNDGTAIKVTTFAAVDVRNCTHNRTGTQNLTGYFFRSTVDCRVRLIACKCLTADTTLTTIQNDVGRIEIHGGEYVASSGYTANNMVSQLDGDLTITDGCRFVTGDASAGSVTCVSVTAGNLHVGGATVFDDGSGNSNIAIAFSDGVYARVSDDVSFENILPYASFGIAAFGSYLAVLPSGIYDIGSGSTVTIYRYSRSAWIESSNASAPAITIQDPLYRGQAIDIFVYNKHGSSTWSSAPSFPPTDAQNTVNYAELEMAPLANGHTLSFRLVAQESNTALGGATLLWVQSGAASILTNLS